MNIQKLAAALSSNTRILIAKILTKKPLSSTEVCRELKKEKSILRESVYRALERLVEAGLLKKMYDQTDKKVKYRLVKKKITIDFEEI